MKEARLCDECVHGVRDYADGYVFRDWSGTFDGDVSTLPKVPDQSKFWTFVVCKKNVKQLLYINLDGKCTAFQRKK